MSLMERIVDAFRVAAPAADFVPRETSSVMELTAQQLLAIDPNRSTLPAAPSASLLAVDQPGARQPLYRQVAINSLFNWMAGVPDPDEVLRRTGRSRANLRELLRDSEVSQAIDTRRDALIATPWRLEGGGARGAKFVLDELCPIIDRALTGFWEATLFGYQVGEVVYGRRGANIGIDDVAFIGFEYYRPTPSGLRYFPQTGEGGAFGIECDPRKFFMAARNATARNPYGEALLSVLYWPVTWRLQGWQLWLSFLETFGAPIVVGKTSDYNKFVEAMTAQGVTRSVAWQATSDKDSIDTISANATGEFDKMNQALNETIQRCVLGQTLTSGVGKVGSFAAAKVHNNVRDDKRRADIRLIVPVMQGIVNSLWTLNGFSGDPPTFEIQDDVGLEQERADRDAVLSALGVRFTESYFTERYDLEAEDFTLTDPTPPPAFGAPTPGAKPAREGLAALLAARSFTPQQQVIERGIDEVLGNLGEVIARAEIKAAIRAATSPEDLAERLAALVEDADAPEFQQLFERALFAADIVGYAHASSQQQPPA